MEVAAHRAGGEDGHGHGDGGYGNNDAGDTSEAGLIEEV